MGVLVPQGDQDRADLQGIKMRIADSRAESPSARDRAAADCTSDIYPALERAPSTR
jgi:hypothetical protein